MSALGSCPRVVLSKGGKNFGVCNLGDSIEERITIKNMSCAEVLIESPVLSQFHMAPKKFRLGLNETKELVIQFKPKNLGKIDIKTEFTLNKEYTLLFRLEG